MKKLMLLVLFLFPFGLAYSQLGNQNMYLLKNLNEHMIPAQFNAPWHYAAIWGYTAPNGREYAVLCAGLGTAFIDVTDSANIREVDFMPADINFSNPDQGNIWREAKVYSHYAYVVSEADSSGIEIYDLQYMPDSVRKVGKFFLPGHSSTHSISQSGHFLYLNGSNPSFGHGVTVVDLTNPEAPVKRGSWNTRYVHDCRIVNDTIYAMNINSGDGQITVIDATNKDSLRTVTQWLNNPNPSPHNCALTPGRRFLYATDEVGALPRLLKVWNIQDLTNPVQVTTWQPTGITGSRVHNVEIYGDTAVIAHYTAGVRVLNISNPAAPVEIAWYDTRPQNNNDQFAGCWGVYKFQSGKIIASDMQTGLYVLKIGNTVGITNNNTIVTDYSLSQNYPNPFNPETKITFSIPEKGFTTLKIFDISGREINTAVAQNLGRGSYTVGFNASQLSSGVYFYRLDVNGFTDMKKMLLVK
jgi:choice-of-anchor B domain-containing protein